jgi:hypothetical protein
MCVIQHRLICRPSDSTVSEEAGIEPGTVVTLALTVGRSNHMARSYPRNVLRSKNSIVREKPTKQENAKVVKQGSGKKL